MKNNQPVKRSATEAVLHARLYQHSIQPLKRVKQERTSAGNIGLGGSSGSSGGAALGQTGTKHIRGRGGEL